MEGADSVLASDFDRYIKTVRLPVEGECRLKLCHGSHMRPRSIGIWKTTRAIASDQGVVHFVGPREVSSALPMGPLYPPRPMIRVSEEKHKVGG